MNETQLLLVMLMEECAEVAKETSKALRFGLSEIMPGQPLNNRERILNELQDLWATVELLGLQQVDRQAIERKKIKIAAYMDRSKRCGLLGESASKAQLGSYVHPSSTNDLGEHCWTLNGIPSVDGLCVRCGRESIKHKPNKNLIT